MGNFGTTGEREVGVGPGLGFVASARARPTLPQWLFFPLPLGPSLRCSSSCLASQPGSRTAGGQRFKASRLDLGLPEGVWPPVEGGLQPNEAHPVDSPLIILS